MIKQFAKLDDDQKAQVFAQFSATHLIGGMFDDYVYEIDEHGYVISRRTCSEHERDNAVLIKPQPTGVRIDGWEI